MIEIRASYPFKHFPKFDDVILNAVGRESDFAGSDGNMRDHGWVCQNEFEAEKIKRALKKIGLTPRLKENGHD